MGMFADLYEEHAAVEGEYNSPGIDYEGTPLEARMHDLWDTLLKAPVRDIPDIRAAVEFLHPTDGSAHFHDAHGRLVKKIVRCLDRISPQHKAA